MTTKPYLLSWTAAYDTYGTMCGCFYAAENREEALEVAYLHYMKEAGRLGHGTYDRSEERRVGKECRSRWSPDH